MKIFTAAQIRACDACTIQRTGIQPIALMEQAAARCVEWLRSNFAKDTLFVVLCGPGNNGGDGLAIARLLQQRQYGIKAFLLHFGKELSPECQINYDKLKAINESLVTVLEPDTFISGLPPHLVIVDAIFGTGLDRPASGWVGSFLERINQMPNRKIAIDMPSGLSADNIPDKESPVLQVSDTLSFQFFKRTFLHPESAPFAGNIHILDIGLDKNYIRDTKSQYRITEAEADIKKLLKPRPAFAHKGTFGSALVVGGSHGKIGAMVLAARAALRAGAGLVTALVPECGYTIMQAAVPEAMCVTSGTGELNSISDWKQYQAIGIGPGMGVTDATRKALADFLEDALEPVVLDADALNIIGQQHDLLSRLPRGSVITPHPKEFSRIFGENTNSMIQLDNARIQAMRYGINIVLKGHYTAVIDAEGECWYNITGNPGMATGGSGDVLTGLITGLLAQGYQPHEAAVMGVYLHGLAGDIAAGKHSQEAMIAGDIVENLGAAFASVAG